VAHDGAPHAFYAETTDRTTGRKPAEDGWKRMQAWLRKHGVA
jgi:carboxymethylenebutenolidase